MVCDYCEKDKPDVEIVIDPYYEDIYGEKIERALCAECYEESADDI